MGTDVLPALAGLEVLRLTWLPGTLLIAAPGALRLPMPDLSVHPRPLLEQEALAWRLALPPRPPRFRSFDLLSLYHSVRLSRSPARAWAEDWWHHGERSGWWEER